MRVCSQFHTKIPGHTWKKLLYIVYTKHDPRKFQHVNKFQILFSYSVKIQILHVQKTLVYCCVALFKFVFAGTRQNDKFLSTMGVFTLGDMTIGAISVLCRSRFNADLGTIHTHIGTDVAMPLLSPTCLWQYCYHRYSCAFSV